MDRIAKLSCSCSHQKPYQEPSSKDILEEDRRLNNWRKWLAKHSKQQKHLTNALKREPRELALNSHERTRSRKETEFLIEAADAKYRGDEDYFKVRILDTWFIQEKKKRPMKTKISDKVARITRVGLPRLMQLEKSLVDVGGQVDDENCNYTQNFDSFSKYDSFLTPSQVWKTIRQI